MQAFDIPSQAMREALISFAIQANISIALPEDGLEGLTSSALFGRTGVDAGLARILAGSGYSALKTGTGAWRITKAIDTSTRHVGRGPYPNVAVPARPPTTPGAISYLDKVLVIAKQPIAIDETTRSVARLDQDRLDQLNATSLKDLAGDLGGVEFTNMGPGRNKVMVRGVSDGALSGRAQSTTGIYFGDVRLTYSAPDPDLLATDLQSVEILRGPQGALYGAGAIGGVLRMDPKPVDLDRTRGFLAGETGAYQGGDAGSRLEAMINLPIVKDRLGVRVVGYDEQTGGWINNHDRDIEAANSTHRRGFRAAAQLRLTNTIEIGLHGLSQEINSDDSQYLILSDDDHVERPNILEPHDNDLSMVDFNLTADTSAGQLTLVSAVVTHDMTSRYDANGLFPTLIPEHTENAFIDEVDHLKIYQTEARMASRPSDRFTWLAGVFHAYGQNDRDIYLGALDEGRPATFHEEDRTDSLTESALFGNVNWWISDNVELAIGGRFFRYNSRSRTGHEADNAGSDAFQGTATLQGFAPDLRLNWTPMDTLSLHASASEGYRNPGFNTGGAGLVTFATDSQPFRQFDGDELWTYELGMQWRSPGGRLEYTLTGFMNDWSRVLTDELNVAGFPFTGNAGDSQGYGAETYLMWRPLDQLTLRANAIISEPHLTAAAASFPAAHDARLPGSSELSGAVSLEYADKVQSPAGNLDISADFGLHYIGVSALNFGQGPDVGDYCLGRLGFGVSQDRWQVSARVENLFNVDGASVSNGNPYQIGRQFMVTPVEPRRISLRLALKY